MRLSNIAKKGMALVLSLAMVVGATAATSAETANAASSAKVRFNAYCYTADGNWIAGDGSTAKLAAKTVTVKKGKTVNVSVTIKGKAPKGVGVLTIDSGNNNLSGGTKGVLETFKTAKYSNVKVTCDGKAVSAKSQQGYFEKNEKTGSWRLSFFNQWGSQGDTTASKCKANAKKIKFKKSCVISFSFTAK